MSITTNTINSPSIFLKRAPYHTRKPKPKPIISGSGSGSRKTTIQNNKTLNFNLNYSQPQKWYGYSNTGKKMGTWVRASSSNGEDDLRGESTMPDRFRFFTKELPSKPLRWPLLIVLAFAIYSWRTVLWELSNWRNLLTGIFKSIGYVLKLIFALIYRFIGDPISYTILYIETAIYAIRSLYSSIVTAAPIPELSLIIMLASLVLSIGEAASPNSINSQPYMLTFAGLIGYGAVKGVIIEPFFWVILVGIFCFSRFFKKRDYVSSVLPVATVLASVGEVWIRVLVITLFTMLAIHHYSKDREGKKEDELSYSAPKVPFPLLVVALAIGVRAAAKWAGYRHLTWMIV